MKTDNILIHPSKLEGEINAISSKSFAHRALIMAGLAKKPTNIYINEFSKDINVTIDSLENLGVKIKKDKNLIKIIPPNEKIEKAIIDMYESGSSLRFFTGVCSHFSKNTKILGEKRLAQRPNLELINNLRKHGLEISSDKIPYTIKGKLKSGKFEFLENKSSQYITAIMLAASKLDGKTYIKLKQKPESIGYIDITRKVLKDFNVDVKKENNSYIIENPQIISPKNYYVEGDWSNASFFYGANLLGSKIKIKNLDEKSLQKDREIVEICQKIKKCKKENIQVLFVATPWQVTEEEHQKDNYIKRIVEEAGFRFLDGNYYAEEMGLEYNVDFYNPKHTNAIGAAKFTTYLGNYIREHYDIKTDHSEEVAASWDKAAEKEEKEYEKAAEKILKKAVKAIKAAKADQTEQY